MAIMLHDGFDLYNGTGAPLGLAGVYASVTAGTTLVTGRFGGQAVQIAYAASNSGRLERNHGGAATSAATLAFAFKCASFPGVAAGQASPGVRLAGFINGGTTQVGIIHRDSGAFDIYRYTSTVAGVYLGSVPAGSWAPNVWHFIEIECVGSDTIGRVTVYVDNVQKVNLTGLDTANGTTLMNGFAFGNPGTGTYGSPPQIDDLHFLDVATRIGERRNETLYAVSDGGTLLLVPSTGVNHFAVVDETLVASSDYLSGSAVGDLDLLGLGNLSSTPASIDSLNVISYAQKTDATARAINNGIKSGATSSNGADLSLAVGFARRERYLFVDPDTGIAWTPGAVNALELQPRVAV